MYKLVEVEIDISNCKPVRLVLDLAFCWHHEHQLSWPPGWEKYHHNSHPLPEMGLSERGYQSWWLITVFPIEMAVRWVYTLFRRIRRPCSRIELSLPHGTQESLFQRFCEGIKCCNITRTTWRSLLPLCFGNLSNQYVPTSLSLPHGHAAVNWAAIEPVSWKRGAPLPPLSQSIPLASLAASSLVFRKSQCPSGSHSHSHRHIHQIMYNIYIVYIV